MISCPISQLKPSDSAAVVFLFCFFWRTRSRDRILFEIPFSLDPWSFLRIWIRMENSSLSQAVIEVGVDPQYQRAEGYILVRRRHQYQNSSKWTRSRRQGIIETALLPERLRGESNSIWIQMRGLGLEGEYTWIIRTSRRRAKDLALNYRERTADHSKRSWWHKIYLGRRQCRIGKSMKKLNFVCLGFWRGVWHCGGRDSWFQYWKYWKWSDCRSEY